MDRKKILIVEDDEEVRDTLKDVLEERGFEIIVAANGREGLLKLQKNSQPHLVLLDLMMPHANGWQFLEHQKADQTFAKIPVVVISAFPESARTLDVAAFIPKPIRLDYLIKTVSQLSA
jgi:CheY-like chemotaxis protein